MKKSGGKNVVFATGTPISNTAAEIWTFMKYLLPKQVMEANDIYYFDDFVRNFGSISQSLEFTTGGKFRENTRFAAYFNTPELIRLWASISDTVLTKEIGYVNDKVPDMETGKAQDVFLPQTDALVDIMRAIRAKLDEFEQMSGKEKKQNSHIPITMYGLAKRAAIDPRLILPDAPDDAGSKTNKAVDEILASLKQTEDYKGTVAVFCDSQNGPNGFNLFADMREKLIEKGLSASKIIIMKSGMTAAAKERIFADVNNGNARVIFGSTATLGTGVNIQERLHTLIHMDAPDRPMDYTQRNGRILRQGNLHKQWDKTVKVLRFGVEDSLDVTSYQRLKTKAAFIDSIMDGKALMANAFENRTLEEAEEGLFDNPVAVLSGSQYAMLKNGAERELRKWKSKKQQHNADQIYISNALRKYEAITKRNIANIEDREARLKIIEKHFPSDAKIELTFAGKKASTEQGIELILKDHVNKIINEKTEEARKNSYHRGEDLSFSFDINGIDFNFNVHLTRDANYDEKIKLVRVSTHKSITYSSKKLGLKDVPVSGQFIKGGLQDIFDNVITGNDDRERIEAHRRDNERMAKESESMRTRAGKSFPFDAELTAAAAKVSEYTELMKKEMAEKEAKYASKGTGSKSDIDIDTIERSEDDSEIDNVLYRSNDISEPLINDNTWQDQVWEQNEDLRDTPNLDIYQRNQEDIQHSLKVIHPSMWHMSPG